jgi:hypothetical protein
MHGIYTKTKTKLFGLSTPVARAIIILKWYATPWIPTVESICIPLRLNFGDFTMAKKIFCLGVRRR